MSPETIPRDGDRMELKPNAVHALAALDEHKAQQTVVLEMRDVAGFTDTMILTTGTSERHVKALVDAVRDRLADKGVETGHVEGLESASWVLIDCFDLIVHVFTPESRDFYQLEKLWRDAPLLEWDAGAPSAD